MITVQPADLVVELGRVLAKATPKARDVGEVRRQLLARKAELGLRDRVAAEYVAESLLRCLIVDHLQRQFGVAVDELPSCINSSHRATRSVCWKPLQHRHHRIADAEWEQAWCQLQLQHPEVNVRVADDRPAKRADLYVVTQRGIVSVEFKYTGEHGLRDASACAAQMQRYIERHAATLLAIYDGGNNKGELRGLDRLRSRLDPAVRVVVVSGPEINAK